MGRVGRAPKPGEEEGSCARQDETINGEEADYWGGVAWGQGLAVGGLGGTPGLRAFREDLGRPAVGAQRQREGVWRRGHG